MDIAIWTIISLFLVSLSLEIENKSIMHIKKFREIKVAPEVIRKISNIDFDKLQQSKYAIELKRFVEVVTQNLPNNNLDNLYNNIDTLKIKKVPFLYKSSAYYNPTNNTIVLSKNKQNCIYHELFHMASSRFIDKNNIYCGFQQVKNASSIGLGINEGYTQFLTKKYFHDYGLNNAYPFQTFAAATLEKIIGKDKMESYYLTNNLIGLIDDLKKYSSQEDIIKFLNNLDCITPSIRNYRVNTPQRINDIYMFLYNICFSKLNEELDIKSINTYDYFSKLSNFFTEIATESNDFVASDLSEKINQTIEEKRKVYQKKKDIYL